MFDILRGFFGKVPVAGEIYELSNNDKSPFDNDPPHKVEVIAVKMGWVNYRWLDSIMWQNESMKVGSFRFCYRLASTACSGLATPSAKSSGSAQKANRLPNLFDEPNWKPLEDLLPREKCAEFTWMGVCIGGIQMYKHIYTRHYLNIDNAGDCFIYNRGNYEKITKESALEIVFDNYNAA